MKINVVKRVLEANDAVAASNRTLMSDAGVLCVNITSAPGSGKTTLLVRAIPALAEAQLASAVIVGDLQTTRDAERIGATGAPVTQINTEGGCHLSATQVTHALHGLDLAEAAIVFIENVGNMVCPAGFDLGEHKRVAVLSTPEGDDKVAKYPTLFQPADAILLNKIDLAGPLDFDRRTFYDDLKAINSRSPMMELSARTGEGVDAWVDWLVAAHTQHAQTAGA
ncbi:MAG: hydrogenase nickel incorporation protein HypB [Phycisphaerae bacterium]|nr:hydrogenase nickel incorporation protein HypB [Phycisphaerae bacterium]